MRMTILVALFASPSMLLAATNCKELNQLQPQPGVIYILEYAGESPAPNTRAQLDSAAGELESRLDEYMTTMARRVDVTTNIPVIRVLQCEYSPVRDDFGTQRELTSVTDQQVVAALWGHRDGTQNLLIDLNFVRTITDPSRMREQIEHRWSLQLPDGIDQRGWSTYVANSDAYQASIYLSIGLFALQFKRYEIAKLSLCTARAALQRAKGLLVHPSVESLQVDQSLIEHKIVEATVAAKADKRDLDSKESIRLACNP